MENILTDGTVFHHAPVNTVMLLNINRLNFDGLAGKCPKCQNFSLSKFCAIRYVHAVKVWYITWHWRVPIRLLFG